MKKELSATGSISEQLNILQQQVTKPNILVCGATGSGKSSLVNDIFGENLADIGHSRPVTRGISRYERADLSVNLYDSEGYELGKENISHFVEDILGYIDRMIVQNPEHYENQIHAVWYCISLAAKRVTDLDIHLIRELARRKIPVCVVLTKLDAADADDLAQMKAEIASSLPGVESFACSAVRDPDIQAAVLPYVERDELIAYTVSRLPDALKEGLVRACVGALRQKREHINKHVVPVYISSACAAVVVPVPLSDSAILAPIQMAMTARIMSVYGIDKIKGAVSGLLETTVVSQIGKSLSATALGSLAKLIPGVGTGVGVAVNTVIATAITTVLGYSMSELCFQYSKEVIEKGQADIGRYFNSENVSRMIRFFLEQSIKRNGK